MQLWFGIKQWVYRGKFGVEDLHDSGAAERERKGRLKKQSATELGVRWELEHWGAEGEVKDLQLVYLSSITGVISWFPGIVCWHFLARIKQWVDGMNFVGEDQYCQLKRVLGEKEGCSRSSAPDPRISLGNWCWRSRRRTENWTVCFPVT